MQLLEWNLWIFPKPKSIQIWKYKFLSTKYIQVCSYFVYLVPHVSLYNPKQHLKSPNLTKIPLYRPQTVLFLCQIWLQTWIFSLKIQQINSKYLTDQFGQISTVCTNIGIAGTNMSIAATNMSIAGKYWPVSTDFQILSGKHHPKNTIRWVPM